MDVPEPRYALSGDLKIAYQVVGDGPLDLLMVPANFSNIELLWELPSMERFLGRLASFSRVILFDRRGNGMSDGITGATPLEGHVDDVRAVLDAVGAQQPALVSTTEGCALSALYAASHPGLVRALIMVSPVPRPMEGPGYEWAQSLERRASMVKAVIEHWGTSSPDQPWATFAGGDERTRRSWARYLRLAMSPGGAAATLATHGETDVRELLPSVQCPTLVLRPASDTFFDERHSRYVAEHVPNARYVKTPGSGPVWFDSEAAVAIADEIEHFLTGMRPAVVSDRVLATVLFTDIVGSTERAAALGDGAWRSLLDRHDTLVREEVERHRGRLVRSLGDGALAVFDGPSRAISSATAIRDRVRDLDLEIRAGLHTGEIELSGAGIEGIAVHIGARVSSLAAPGEVLASSTVRDLIVGSGRTLTDRGEHDLKGVPGPWRVFAVET
ncbi:MAG: adenylate/guanylate cyclase domain-containing protein [Gaiellaceae bacterium]